MFKTTTLITSSGLTFLTVNEFKDELEKYYDSYNYKLGVDNFEVKEKIINREETLTDGNTLTTITIWDNEASYIEFYKNSVDDINALETAGYIRTVTTENI